MQVSNIPIDRLSVSKANMRGGKKPPDITDILPSVIKRGVIIPVIVRPNCQDGHFEICAGKRRYFASLAAQAAGKEDVTLPCITVRWIIGDTTSGVGNAEQVHILVKPTRADLKTNMLINTDRRTYHLELRANVSTYMASVSWSYPLDELIAIRGRARAAEAAAPIASGITIPNLSFSYKISGDKPDWRPVRVFDDGVRTFIEFPEAVARGEMPPVFVIGANGEGELVNYRVAGRHIVVDRLFAAAELRMGDRKSEQRVRITRDGRERRR